MTIESPQRFDRGDADEPLQVLRVRGIERSFGEVIALRGVDLDVRTGEVVGLLGPNGAGKTTLVQIIATLLAPDDGEVHICGADAVREPAAARGHLGLAGQFASVDEVLTGRENLEMIGRLYGISADDARTRAAALLGSFGLVDAADRRVATYSGGMRRRLDLGATLIGEPALLLLDEPTTGLDPRSRLDMWELIDEIARGGTAVLITSQNLDEVERLADRVIVLDDGRSIADAPVDVLRNRIGGQVLDLAVSPEVLGATAGALRACGLDASVDEARRRVVAATTGGLHAVVDASHALIDASTEPDELALRSPSLEEAFLSLTETPRPSRGPHEPGEADVRTTIDRTRPLVTRSTGRDVRVLVGRELRRLVRSPESLFFALAMPLLFVVGLAAVFGDLVEAALGQDYIQFVLPGVLVMQITLAAGVTGVGLATDLRDGIIDRFRSLPITPASVLVGRTTADLIRNAAAAVVMVAAGVTIGYRLDGGAIGGMAALGVALLFGYAMTWVFAAVGLAVEDPQAANFLGFAPVLLFVYLSSAWVPIETMHPSVQGFARNQPVNVVIDAVRGLAAGTSSAADVVSAIVWSLGILVASAWIATRRLREATA